MCTRWGKAAGVETQAQDRGRNPAGRAVNLPLGFLTCLDWNIGKCQIGYRNLLPDRSNPSMVLVQMKVYEASETTESKNISQLQSSVYG